MPMGRFKISVTYDLYFIREAPPTTNWIRDSFAGDLEVRFASGVDGFDTSEMTISPPEQLPYDPPPEC